MMDQVGSLGSLRTRNRTLVRVMVGTGQALTRVDIARRTGLSRTTVSSLVNDLISDGVMVELPDQPRPGPGGGRPAVTLALSQEVGTVFGVHLGHDIVRVALADLNGVVLGERSQRVDVDHEPVHALTYVADTASLLLAEADVDRDRVASMGVAVSSPVTLGSRALAKPSMLFDWNEVDVAGRLRGLVDLPVHVGNDANLGALAEWTYGAARGVDDLIYVMLSHGVGAGLILGGRLYEGAGGLAGELGHVAVTADGHICRCGNRGCLETVAGSRGLVEALTHSHGPLAGSEDVLALSADRDPGARRVLNDAGRAVGRALAGICTMLDPRMVIIGGSLAEAGSPLFDGVREALTTSLPPVTNQALQVVPGELGDRAEVLGAVSIAIRQVLDPA